MVTEEKTAKKVLKGGEFLIKETDANDIFIPEQWDEEQQMIAQTNRDFIEQEILIICTVICLFVGGERFHFFVFLLQLG